MKLKNQLLISALLSSTISFTQNTQTVEETQGLQVGDSVQSFTAKDQFGNPIVLKDALEKGPVVVIFYRGQWCPFCNKHLSNIQDSLNLITTLGATVIAVSPENQKNLLKTSEKTEAEFILLHDENYVICDLFKVLFEPTEAEVQKYNTFLGADLENAHEQNSVMLPVPATFIIDTNGKIKWRHFEHNYKERSSVIEIINQL